MKEKSYGGILVVLAVCIIGFGVGAVFGMAHVGEDFSKEILPTSLTRSSDIVQVIDEKSFVPENITVKYQTQTKVKQVVKNTTNYTVNTTNDSDTSEKNNSRDKYSSSKYNHSYNSNNTNHNDYSSSPN